MCDTKNIQHDSVEDIENKIVEVAFSLRHEYHLITIVVFCDNCCLLTLVMIINRVYIKEIKEHPCYKCKLNGVNLINQTD